jgi:hypothetical protein
MRGLKRKIMEDPTGKFTHIKGWGIDADPANDPTYPMKKYTGDDHRRLNYQRPPLQQTEVEILHSNERPDLTAVYGTTTPPGGLSGRLRRYAFRYSEGSFGHWIPLLLADRVNMVEGVVDDLRKGHIPNIFAERGWKSEWKYNRPRMVKKGLVAIGLIAVTAVFLSRRLRSHPEGNGDR